MSAASTVVYIDSSALVKLVVPEPESDALRAELAGWDRHVSSALARVEVVRACARVDEKAGRIAEQVVGALDLIALDERVLEEAALLRPVELRSFDSIHLASALLLGDALGVALVYDERLLEAMQATGMPVAAPR
ncbi:MAG TPA: type II toxin-antitoxin system VapC family toxin [Gaiellaceae bacterium]